MLRLPLLIRILPVRPFEEEVIVGHRLFDIPQMIVRRRPEEIGDGDFREKFRSCVQSFEGQGVVFVLAGSERQIAIGGSQVWLELYGGQELLLRVGKLLLAQQRYAKLV